MNDVPETWQDLNLPWEVERMDYYYCCYLSVKSSWLDLIILKSKKEGKEDYI
jgi:hypothetical protein